MDQVVEALRPDEVLHIQAVEEDVSFILPRELHESRGLIVAFGAIADIRRGCERGRAGQSAAARRIPGGPAS